MSTPLNPAGEPAARLRLSKSRFTSGLQCHKQLWWRVHEPDAAELVPDAARQAIFDQGHVVGAAAQGYFIHVYVDRAGNIPVPLPAPLRLALEPLLV